MVWTVAMGEIDPDSRDQHPRDERCQSGELVPQVAIFGRSLLDLFEISRQLLVALGDSLAELFVPGDNRIYPGVEFVFLHLSSPRPMIAGRFNLAKPHAKLSLWISS